MKIKLIVILTMLFIGISYSQETTVTNEKVSSTVVYNDSKDAIKQVYNDVKSLSPEVKKAITSLANTFNTTVDKLWDIIVKQQQVYSIVYLILTLASLFNWWLFYKRNLNKPKKEDVIIGRRPSIGEVLNPQYDKYYAANYPTDIKAQKYLKGTVGEEDYILDVPNKMNWFKYLHLIICLTLSIFSFLHFSDMLTGFINPEYSALKTILNVATQLK